MSAKDSNSKCPSFGGRSPFHFPAPAFYELASEVTQHHFCSILLLLSKLGPCLRFKEKGIRLHLLMGKGQVSGKACGMGGIVFTTILGKYNLSQVATNISHTGLHLPICVMWIATALMSALGLYRGLLLSKPQGGLGPSFPHDVPIKRILQAGWGPKP